MVAHTESVMSDLSQSLSATPPRIIVSDQVRADLAGRVYRLTFPAQLEATACARKAAGSRWDPQRQVWLLPARDADRVRATLERIEQALLGARRRNAPDADEEDEPRVLVRNGQASVGQRISTPDGWAVIESLGPAFLGGERLRRSGRPDLAGVALRWAYCRLDDRQAA